MRHHQDRGTALHALRGIALMLVALAATQPVLAAGWTALAPLPQARAGHSSTLLPDGRVLVAGGRIAGSYTASTVIYRPANDTWIAGPAMSVPRVQHTATALRDGRVLVVAGQSVEGASLASAEIYDPATNTWSATGSLATTRRVHTAVLMADGRVLLNGGHSDTTGVPLASAERFDPATGVWTSVPDMSNTRHSGASLLLPNGLVMATGGFSGHVDRYDPASNTWTANSAFGAGLIVHSLTLLGNGKVWLAGGYSGAQQASTHVYDPSNNSWVPGPNLPTARAGHQAALLPSGDVLLIGGNMNDTQGLAVTVRYRPASNTVVTAESMSVARRSHASVMLADGRVLVTGGFDDAGAELASVEAYEDATPIFTGHASMNQWRSAWFTSTRLADGQILVVGGNGTPPVGGLGFTRSGERYNPATGTWTPIADLAIARSSHAAVRLLDGRVLVTGGINASGLTEVFGELYDPVANTWSAIAPDLVGRFDHSMHVLDDGRVLVIGGTNSFTQANDREIYDPINNQWSIGSAGIVSPRDSHASVRLQDGRILVAGGRDAPRTGLEARTEVFDPVTRTWSQAGNLVVPRIFPAMTLLADGRVLMTCGINASHSSFFAAEIYDPNTNTWTSTGTPQRYRAGCASVLLADGRVLVSGGSGTNADNSAELFDPQTGAWQSAGALLARRETHRAELLPDGRAILIGGGPQAYSYEIFDPQPQRDMARMPTLAPLPFGVAPTAGLTLSGSGFQPPHSADTGTNYTSRSNLPFVRIVHLDKGDTRELPIDRSQSFSNTSLSTMPGAFSNLPPGPAVVSVSLNGLRAYSSVVQIANRLPTAPTGVMAMPGDGRAFITFQPPSNNGGSPITGYEVTITPGGARVECGLDCPGGLLLDTLSNGTSYTFVVRGVNAIGRGAASAPSAAITPSTSACNSSPLALTIAVEQAVSCAGGNNGALRATPSGGAAPYTIQWSPGGTSGNVLSGIGAGDYSATVTDALLCTRTSASTLTQPPALTVQTSSDPTRIYGICEGVVRANVSGGTAPYTYLWPLTGHTTATAGAMCAGVHPVTIQDANQCSANASATVIGPPSVPRNLTVTPGDRRATLNFDPPADSGGGDIGAYQATCGAITITRFQMPPPFDVPFLTNGEAVTCTVRAVNLNVPHSQFGPTDLFGPPTSPSASVTPLGLPEAPPAPTAQAGNGRVLANISGPTSNENGSPVTAYRFTASPAGAAVDCAVPCSTGVMLTGLSNGTEYTLTVQAINAAGAGAASPPSLPVTPSAATCASSGLALSVGAEQPLRCALDTNGALRASPSGGRPPYAITWQPGSASGEVLSEIGAGSYTATVTDDLGCSVSATADFTGPPLLTVSISTTPASPRGSCNGSAEANPSGGTPVGGPGYGYAWSTGQISSIANNLCAGPLSLTVTDGNQCTTTASATIVEPPSAPTLLSATPGDTQATVSFSAPAADGGAAVLFYRASCGLSSSDGPGSPLIVSGLSNGDAITCSVRAHNVAGEGDASAISATITPRAAQTIVFGPLPSLRIGDSAMLSAAGGGSGNPVVFQSTTPGVCTTGETNGSTVSGVAVGVCRITANQAGSAAFEPAAEVTVEFNVLINQFRVTPSAIGMGTIDPGTMLMIDAGAVTSFTLTPAQSIEFSVDGSCGGTLTGNVFTTAPVVQDCSVTARFFTTPAAIADFTLVPLNNAIRAEFAAPDDGGTAILDYSLDCTPEAQAVAPSSPITINGLINNRVYRCHVRARNLAGAGPPSAVRSVIPGTTGNSADLAIAIDNGATFVNGAEPVVYTVTVINTGPSAALAVRAEDSELPPEFSSASWTCHAPPTAHCRQASGLGALDSLLDLPVGVSVELRYTAIAAPGGEPPLSMTVAVLPPDDISDPELENNVASDGPDAQGVFRDGFD